MKHQTKNCHHFSSFLYVFKKNKLLKLIEQKWKYINKHMEKYYENNKKKIVSFHIFLLGFFS